SASSTSAASSPTAPPTRSRPTPPSSRPTSAPTTRTRPSARPSSTSTSRRHPVAKAIDSPALDLSHDTFPRLLLQRAEQRPTDVAMQEKLYGIWQPITWAEYARRVEDFANGLARFGVERGQIIAVLGDNRPEWLIAELAAQSMGASVVGIYPTSIGEELEHILATSQARVVVVEDQEQVDKLLKLRETTELGVERVIFYDPHGLEQYDDPWLIDFTEVERLGRERAEQLP